MLTRLTPLILVLVPCAAVFALGRQTAAPAAAAPQPVSFQQAVEGARYFGPWEYEVVGLTDIYASTLDYLKGALDKDESGERNLGGLLGFGKKVDDQLVAKTRDLLNEYGAKGWELAEYRENVLVFKRPQQPKTAGTGAEDK